MSVGIYVLLCFTLSQSRKPLPAPSESLRLVFHAVAAGALLAAVCWIQFRTANRIRDLSETATPSFGATTATATTATATTTASQNLMTPGEFQTETIIALAIAEVCVILGLTYFFLGAPLAAFLPLRSRHPGHGFIRHSAQSSFLLESFGAAAKPVRESLCALTLS
jgi:hypothetical protein